MNGESWMLFLKNITSGVEYLRYLLSSYWPPQPEIDPARIEQLNTGLVALCLKLWQLLTEWVREPSPESLEQSVMFKPKRTTVASWHSRSITTPYAERSGQGQQRNGQIVLSSGTSTQSPDAPCWLCGRPKTQCRGHS